MGVDYTWGVGYGIAVPLDDVGEERLIEVLNNHFGTDVDPEDGLWEFDGLDEVKSTGLSISWAGNAWQGTDRHAVILVSGSRNGGEHRDLSGVHVFGKQVPDTTAIQNVGNALIEADIDFLGHGWMFYGSVI